MSRGKRYDTQSKLNIKKVIAVIMAFAVMVMFVIAIITLLTSTTNEKTTSISNYYPVFTDNKWGVIDGTGEFVIAPTYDEMITIPDSKTDLFICVQNVDQETNNYTVKVLNAKNKEILTDYNQVEAIENIDYNNNMWYEEGVLKVKKQNQYGLVDFNQKEILKPEYEEITPLLGVKNSLILKKDGKVGLCDTKGNIIIKPEYKEIRSIQDQYQNGYIVINNEGKYGIIDFDSKVILEPEYEDIKQVAGGNIHIVKQNGVWKAISKEQELLSLSNYDNVTNIVQDKLIVVKNNQYGIITTENEEKIRTTI
ncbi:MAG: WG repeat-containing protein [Clostridia bacterium]|nr:WG repeat-containing protein [Clostridia bacterium]